jgi:hypothetical protein
MANPVITGTLNLQAGMRSIGVQQEYTGDDNDDMTVVVEYKKDTESTWKTAFMSNVAPVSSRDSYFQSLSPKEVRTVVFTDPTTPEVEYNFKVTFSDDDGVTGTNPVELSVTTIPLEPDLGSGTEYFVDPLNGDDLDDGLTEADAFKTVQKAINEMTADAGDIVSIMDTADVPAGDLPIEINKNGGVAGNYGTIRSAPNNTNNAKIDGAGTVEVAMWIRDGVRLYWHIKDIDFDGVLKNCIRGQTDQAGEEIGYIQITRGVSTDCFDESSSGNAHVRMLGVSAPDTNIHHIVEYSILIHAPRVDATPGGAGIKAPNGLHNKNIDGPLSIVDNIIGDDVDGGNRFEDCIAIGGTSGDPDAAIGADVGFEVCGNIFRNVFDDGIEVDGGNTNARVFDNAIICSTATSHGGGTEHQAGISVAPCSAGPIFVVRNRIYVPNGRRLLKLGNSSNGPTSGPQFWFHNSGYGRSITKDNGTGALNQCPAIQGNAGDGEADNMTWLNNAWNCDQYIFNAASHAHANCDADYNCEFSKNAATKNYSNDHTHDQNYTNDGDHATLEDFNAAHGDKSLNSISGSDPQFTDPSGDDFTPITGSPCIDAGTVIDGINFDTYYNGLGGRPLWNYVGTRPDIGAVETGEPPPDPPPPPPAIAGISLLLRRRERG